MLDYIMSDTSARCLELWDERWVNVYKQGKSVGYGPVWDSKYRARGEEQNARANGYAPVYRIRVLR